MGYTPQTYDVKQDYFSVNIKSGYEKSARLG